MAKQEAKEATDKRGEEAAAAEGRLLTYNLELFLAFVFFFRFTNDTQVSQPQARTAVVIDLPHL